MWGKKKHTLKKYKWHTVQKNTFTWLILIISRWNRLQNVHEMKQQWCHRIILIHFIPFLRCITKQCFSTEICTFLMFFFFFLGIALHCIFRIKDPTCMQKKKKLAHHSWKCRAMHQYLKRKLCDYYLNEMKMFQVFKRHCGHFCLPFWRAIQTIKLCTNVVQSLRTNNKLVHQHRINASRWWPHF